MDIRKLLLRAALQISRALLALLLLTGLAAPALAFDPWNDAARYRIEYRVDLAALPDGPLRLWIPLPAQGPNQRVSELAIAGDGVRETRGPRGNRMTYLEANGARPETVTIRALVERAPMSTVSEISRPEWDPARFHGAQGRIPLDGIIGRISTQEARGRTTDGEKIRGYYDYVVKRMEYAKHGEGWGQGDAVWACTEQYGNCTDFHSLFIGLTRAQGIASRFAIGFPIPSDRQSAEVKGYHCWSHAYDAPRGWVPLDASEAWKSGRKDAYFGHLPSDRVVFTAGRDLILEPPQDGAPLNFFVYPYAEVAGKPVPRPTWSFRYERVGAEAAQAGAHAR